MQRGGVAGVVGEIDDRFGAYTAESIAHFGLDGGKMLIRFVPDDERTLNTIDYCAQAVTALNRHSLASFVEPLRMKYYANGTWEMQNTAEELIKLVGVLAALGDSSRYTWLKLPFCQNFHQVTLATTLPILILGGPSKEDPRDTYADLAAAMAARNNVRGALVGRNISFPGADDPAAVAQVIHQIIHKNISAETAVDLSVSYRNQDMDALTKYIGE